MQPSRSLPSDYRLTYSFDLKNRKRLILVNFIGLGMFFLFAWLFFLLLRWLRPDDLAGLTGVFKTTFTSLKDLLPLFALIISMILMVILHEGLHGIFFWLFTREKPVFALRLAYAYAGAPDWYLPRNQFLVTALAPLIGISLLGTVLMAVLPPSLLLPTYIFMVVNANGSTADIWVAVKLLLHPRTCLANDRGDSFTLYSPASPQG